jgi:hypothetical protein
MDFLRSKQSGVQRDFTSTLADAPDVFALDEVRLSPPSPLTQPEYNADSAPKFLDCKIWTDFDSFYTCI